MYNLIIRDIIRTKSLKMSDLRTFGGHSRLDRTNDEDIKELLKTDQ
jgi:hypothetical protein